MNATIENIYRTSRVCDEAGNEYPVQSHISRHEGDFLVGLIRSDAAIKRTLEVGCAYGLSSLFICSSTSDRESAKHTIIDPFQYSQWRGIGVTNLKRAGIDFFELIQEPSEYVLSRLAHDWSGSFDLVFIDGWHTFDHTLLDIFYANRLLRVGGYIVVDDCGMPSVSRAISYVARYPCYVIHSQAPEAGLTGKRKLATRLVHAVPEKTRRMILPQKANDVLQRACYSSMVALRKTTVDERNWNWYEDF